MLELRFSARSPYFALATTQKLARHGPNFFDLELDKGTLMLHCKKKQALASIKLSNQMCVLKMKGSHIFGLKFYIQDSTQSPNVRTPHNA